MAKVVQLKNKECYQLKITLEDVKPQIWRRFIVNSNTKLPDLHKIIQSVMGWTNSHLHHFIKDRKRYAEPDEESYMDDDIDYRKIKLNQVLSKEKQSFSYEYDFGDGWDHTIVLEKILKEHNQKYPTCVDGKRSCPPEDCGGSWGYENLLKTISNPKNEEYDEMMDWLGDEFDPEHFDLEEINWHLKEKDFGCITLF